MSQPTEAQADIVERLTAMYSHRGDGLPTQYVNPDGLEAAAEITRLRAQVKIVQSAAKTIMIHEADELRQLREERQQWSHAIKSLDSERDANAVLTDEVERLRAELAEARLQGRREGLEAGRGWRTGARKTVLPNMASPSQIPTPATTMVAAQRLWMNWTKNTGPSGMPSAPSTPPR